MSSPRFPAVVAAAVALVGVVSLHWTGTGMISDSWAYWQGAISLATGNGYTYFSGPPIAAWPPLYSIYLALWVVVAGPQGWVLAAAAGLLVVLQAGLWMRLVRTLADDSDLLAPRGTWLLLAAFTGLFLAVHQRYPFGQGLLYVFLPLLLENLWKVVVRDDERRLPAVVGLALLIPLTHTTGFAFVGAAAVLLAARRPHKPGNLAAAGLVVALPVAAWLATRLVLGQAGSHCIGLGAGRFGPLAYARQLLDGPGRLLVPELFGAPMLAMALSWLAAVALALAGPGQRALRFVLVFCAVALGLIFVLFNVAWIYAAIGGRFVLFVPVLFVALLALAAASRRPAVGAMLLVLLLLPQLYWFGTWVAEQRGSARLFAETPTAFLPHAAYAGRDHLAGPPVRRQGRLMVAPDPKIENDSDCRRP